KERISNEIRERNQEKKLQAQNLSLSNSPHVKQISESQSTSKISNISKQSSSEQNINLQKTKI
ncbi:2954_t:CDS:1, partial [Cetraspora pellucida]